MIGTAHGRRGVGVLALVAAAGVLIAPSALSAQQGGEDEAEEAWLGVGLRQAVRCETRVERQPDGSAERSDDSGCSSVFVAEAVVDGAPAERAGVRPGDTVVAVNGRALSRASGREEFGSLESGRPAQLLVASPGQGRRSVRVTPGPRPRRVAPEKVRTAPPAGPPRALPREAVGPGPARPGRPPDGDPPDVVMGRDGDGRIVLRWRGDDSTRTARLEEMAPRLEAIRDSVFAHARRHIRALRERQREALRRTRDASPDGSRRLFDALRRAESLRAAGAEFRPLSSSLAEYFPGAERGLLIVDVVGGTPADDLGLRPGDVVVEAGEREVASPSDLREALGELPRQDSLVVRWIRKGETSTGVLRKR